MDHRASDLLLSLPTVLCCEILSAWLAVPDLLRLDSGFCNHEKRLQLHALYEQPELICSLNCGGERIEWFVKRRIRLRDFDVYVELPADLVLRYLQEFGHLVQSILLSDGTNKDLIRAVCAHCLNASTLTIEQIADESCKILNAFQSLHSLEICFRKYFSNVKLPTDDLDEVLSLRKLRLSCAETEDMIGLVEKCPRLTHFTAQCCRYVSPESVVSMISLLPKLIALNLSGLPVTNASLTAIIRLCPCIVHLDVHSCSKITDAAMYTVATKLKLKSIALPCCFEITDESLKHMHYCRNTLEEVHIVHWVGYEVKTIKFSLSAIHKLLQSTRNTCQFTWSTYLLKHVGDLRNCTNTTSLTVSTRLTDSLLANIAHTCLDMEILDIHHTTEHKHLHLHLTSEGLFAVINNCPKLKNIHISKKVDKARFADVLTSHSKLFTYSALSRYDVMSLT